MNEDMQPRRRRRASQSPLFESQPITSNGEGETRKRSTIQNDELLTYLQNAISLESDIATQETIMNDFAVQFEEKKPILTEQQIPSPPKTIEMSEDDKTGLAGLLGIGFAVMGMVVLFITMGGGGMDGSIILFLGTLAAVTGIVAYVSGKYANLDTLNNDKYAEYRQACDRIRASNLTVKEMYDRDIHAWTESSNNTLEEVRAHLSETRALAVRFYASKDLIYPKYRTLSALTSIYEYFITGRCTELTGPNGAYNLYEDEMRKDMVISQLSAVLANLEQIKQNQYMLYQKACEIQDTTYAVASELRQIKGYTIQIASLTALSTYYAGLTERNTRISMWCTI